MQQSTAAVDAFIPSASIPEVIMLVTLIVTAAIEAVLYYRLTH